MSSVTPARLFCRNYINCSFKLTMFWGKKNPRGLQHFVSKLYLTCFFNHTKIDLFILQSKTHGSFSVLNLFLRQNKCSVDPMKLHSPFKASIKRAFSLWMGFSQSKGILGLYHLIFML